VSQKNYETKDIVAMVSKVSRCICSEGCEALPCFRCEPEAFNVYWLARWDKQPVVRGAERLELSSRSSWGYTDQGLKRAWRTIEWSVLCPSEQLYPRTIRYRYLLQLTHEAQYSTKTHCWSIEGSAGPVLGAEHESLNHLLSLYRELVDSKDRRVELGKTLMAIKPTRFLKRIKFRTKWLKLAPASDALRALPGRRQDRGCGRNSPSRFRHHGAAHRRRRSPVVL